MMSTEIDGFPKVEFKLTDEQLSALQPLSTLIQQNKGTIVVEAFIVLGDYRFRQARARYLDMVAQDRISRALVAAQDDYVKRHELKERLLDIKQKLTQNGIQQVDIEDNKITFSQGQRRYEIKELAMGEAK